VAVLVQKKGDTRKAAWRTNFSLVNATVVLKVKKGDGSFVTTTGGVAIEDVYAGIVSWDHNGTLAPGDYAVELWISRDGETFKAPSSGYETLRITQDLS